MKKILVTLLAVIMAVAMCSCGSKDEESNLANPVTECTQEEMLEATGLELAAPEGATDVVYAYIEAENEETIAQVQFTVDGNTFCYRAQPTAATSIMAEIDEDGFYMADTLQETLDSGLNIGSALSGLDYEWEACATIDIAHCEGIAGFNAGKAGFVAWLDVAPGILYSLGMDTGCSQDLLMDMAETVFVPVQGEA